MRVIRRQFLQLAGAAFTASAASTATLAQAPAGGPKLAQLLRKDLQGQNQTVQESVVSLVEFGPGAAAPWHMHPGAQEILCVQEGSLMVDVEAQGVSTVRAGEAFIVPADTPHLARNEHATISAKAFVIHSRAEKDKPLVVPVRRGT